MSPVRRYLALAAVGLALGCPKPDAVPAPPPLPFPDQPPEVTPDYTWAPPAPEVATTVAGGRLWHVHRPGLPLVSVRLVLPGGSALDPTDQPGLTAFSNAMLLRGSGDDDAAAFSAKLQDHAIDLGVSTGRTATTFSIDCTADALPRALALLNQALQHARFDPDEVERARSQRIQSRKDALDEPRVVASEVGWMQYFGPDSPLAHPTDGTAEGLARMTPGELSASWASRSKPETARWIVVGDIDQAATLAALKEHFGDWSATGKPPLDHPPPPGQTVPANKGGRILVDNPGASQTVLRVWMPGWTPNDPERVAGDLGTVVLGGTFTSRLNALLREEKGYTYGARASVVTGRGYGAVSVSTNVVIDQTGPALQDLAGELVRITKGITEDEAAKAAASRRTDAIETSAGRAPTADYLAGIVADGRNADGMLADLHMTARIEAPDIDRVLPRLSLDDSLVVVVGDLGRIRAEVETALPGDWVELDTQGNPVR